MRRHEIGCVVMGPRYTMIKGHFYLFYPDLPAQGPEPDGDTVTFLPDNDDLVWALRRFSGTPPDRRHLGAYNIRFEGIDALETHYLGRHQNAEFAYAARDAMLARLGFTGVVFEPNLPNKVKSAAVHPLRGVVYANGIESNGRILGLVPPAGTEPAAEEDGSAVFIDTEALAGTVNAGLIADGLAYAELYGTMPIDLVDRCAAAVKSARAASAGFWPHESFGVGKAAKITSLTDLPALVCFPKMYRRLVSYFLADPGRDLSGFDAWVRADVIRRDDVVGLPTRERGNLHDVYSVDGDEISLRFLPEDLLFEPDPPH
ncbi:hypothetical protein [Nocardia sp. NPDC052566]|uniref:hypothetical protein n=1 Tax=Nocardia sp. NPDC052566 TaxID=3364330 RepID=UPI0037C8743F